MTEPALITFTELFVIRREAGYPNESVHGGWPGPDFAGPRETLETLLRAQLSIFQTKGQSCPRIEAFEWDNRENVQERSTADSLVFVS